MAAFSITVSNSINCFGPDTTNLWGFMLWGVGEWATSDDVIVHVEKSITGSFSLDSSQSFESAKVIANSITSEFETSGEGLKDSAGYAYVFASDTTDAEERDFPTYTSAAAASGAWTAASSTSSVWS